MSHKSTTGGRNHAMKHIAGAEVPNDEYTGRRDQVSAIRGDREPERTEGVTFQRVVERTTGNGQVLGGSHNGVDR
jgi:hypothetical protein